MKAKFSTLAVIVITCFATAETHSVASPGVQGVPSNDTCANPIPLPPSGQIALNNTSATTSGYDGPAGAPCNSAGVFMHRDLFYLWTAPFDCDFEVRVENVNSDPTVFLYSGNTCGSDCVAPGDSVCGSPPGVYSLLFDDAAAGDQFLLQVGNRYSGDGPINTGSMTVISHPRKVNDDCDGAIPISGEVNLQLNGRGAESSFFNQVMGNYGGFSESWIEPITGIQWTIFVYPPHNDVFFQWSPDCPGVYEIAASGAFHAACFAVHTGSACSATFLSGSHDVFGDPSPPFELSVNMGDRFLIQLGSLYETCSGPVSLEITRVGDPCEDGVTSVVCDPPSPHYSGGAVTLGPSSFTGSRLHVEATGGPPSEFGFFLIAPSATNNISLFNGVLCLDAPVARYDFQVSDNQGLPQLNSVGRFDAAGEFENLAGSSTTGFGFDVPNELPYTPAGQVIVPGDTWCIQLWYRDQLPPLPNPGSSANFSDVLVATYP